MFLFQGIVQIRFESGLSEILELSSRDTFTMAETTAYFEAYRHVLEGLREMKDALPMARYLVDCNPTIKPPQYLLSATGTGQMNLSSLRRKNSRWDASAVTIINPQRWPPLEETTLNESQVRLRITMMYLCYFSKLKQKAHYKAKNKTVETNLREHARKHARTHARTHANTHPHTHTHSQ